MYFLKQQILLFTFWRRVAEDNNTINNITKNYQQHYKDFSRGKCAHMRSRNMDPRNRTMEPEREKDDYEPLSKRSRLISDGQDAASSSKLSSELLNRGKKILLETSYLPMNVVSRNTSYHCKMAEKICENGSYAGACFMGKHQKSTNIFFTLLVVFLSTTRRYLIRQQVMIC